MTQQQAFAPAHLLSLGQLLQRDPEGGRRAIRRVPALGKYGALELLRRAMKAVRS